MHFRPQLGQVMPATNVLRQQTPVVGMQKFAKEHGRAQQHQAIGRALDQKASLIRIPGDRSASLRAALRQASGDGETLDAGNAELHRLTTPVSLDKTVGDDGDATLGDLMANGQGTPEDAVMAMVDTELLDELLGTLDDRARYAVEARFGLLDGERKSFREVGEDLGVTAEAARRLVSRAVEGLRDDAERILAV